MEKRCMVITGASSGVGAALARHFASNGWMVFGIARREAILKEMERELEGFHGMPGSVADGARMKEVFDEIRDRTSGRLDVLISNAGDVVRTDHDPMKGEFEGLDRAIDVNLKGAMYCTYLTLDMMVPRRSGYIIIVSSTAGLPCGHIQGGVFAEARQKGVIPRRAYGVAKTAVTKFAQVLRGALRDNGIRITTLCPGGIKTPIWTTRPEVYPGDVDKLIEPEELVGLIDFLIRQPGNTLYRDIVLAPMQE